MIHLFFIFMAMLIDFILTSIGLKVGIIEEANGLMLWLFDLAVAQAFVAKILISLLVLLPFVFLYKKDPAAFKKAYSITYVIFGIVFALHFHWIFQYVVILI